MKRNTKSAAAAQPTLTAENELFYVEREVRFLFYALFDKVWEDYSEILEHMNSAKSLSDALYWVEHGIDAYARYEVLCRYAYRNVPASGEDYTVSNIIELLKEMQKELFSSILHNDNLHNATSAFSSLKNLAEDEAMKKLLRWVEAILEREQTIAQLKATILLGGH